MALNVWTFTEKVDGTNIRVIYKDGVVSFGGRTENAHIPAPLVAKLNERFAKEKFEELFPGVGVVLYGEGYGAKIQKGGENYRQDQDFVLFDVRINGFWLGRDDVADIAGKLDIHCVPIIGAGSLHAAVAMAKDGIKSSWGDFKAEGIVARPRVELTTKKGDRIIAKIKCRDFVANEARND